MDLVIGAGITGLSYCSYKKNHNYIILEKNNSIGGYCKTIKKDDFIWDYSGHFFHFRNEKIKNYVLKYLCSSNILKKNKNTKIYYKKQYIDYPFQKNIHQLNKKEFIDCLYDLYNRPKGQYSNFKDMLYHKFGKSIAEKFLISYNEKLYACNLNLLDNKAMGRFFPYAEIKDIINNFKNSNNKSYNDYFLYPKEGCFEVIKSIFKRVKNSNLSINEELIEIKPEKKLAITNKRTINYNRLISTLPFNILLKKCKLNYNKDIYSWNKVLVYNLGFNKQSNDIKNHWIYFAGKNYIFYRVGYYNNINNSNRMSLYVEIGFHRNETIDTEYYLPKIIKDLKKAGIITNQELLHHHHIIMDPAYVHINQKSINEVKKMKASLKKYNIYSIGRYGSWKYCSMEDNVIEAKSLVKDLGN